jgi:hypothetical protein
MILRLTIRKSQVLMDPSLLRNAFTYYGNPDDARTISFRNAAQAEEENSLTGVTEEICRIKLSFQVEPQFDHSLGHSGALFLSVGGMQKQKAWGQKENANELRAQKWRGKQERQKKKNIMESQGSGGGRHVAKSFR